MPISDTAASPKGHFTRVYEDIIRPACEKAGFKARRADETKQSNLIQLDILQKLLDSPMAICDLSGANPNVMFELALRQAFDKPVALIQEVGNKPIFDIGPLRYTEYRRERLYDEVKEDQVRVAAAISNTFESHGKAENVNSIVRLLGLTHPAKIPQTPVDQQELGLSRLILSELAQLRNELRPTPVPQQKAATTSEPHYYQGKQQQLFGLENIDLAWWFVMDIRNRNLEETPYDKLVALSRETLKHIETLKRIPLTDAERAKVDLSGTISELRKLKMEIAAIKRKKAK